MEKKDDFTRTETTKQKTKQNQCINYFGKWKQQKDNVEVTKTQK